MTNVSVVHADIEQAVATLANGGLVAFPTDTLYALGADAKNAAAVRRVYEIKGREGHKALPLFVSGIDGAEAVGVLTPIARRLVARFWPGALTIVVRVREGFESEALVGGDTVAVRVPDHPVALEILSGLGRPVTATSANLSAGPNPVSAAEVRRQLGGRLDFVLDGGSCEIGVSSTIVDCTAVQPRVLRRGAVSASELEAVLGAGA